MSKQAHIKACEILAERIMFLNGGDVSSWLTNLGLEYRKNKGIDDLTNAYSKAKKQGYQKVEYELSMLEVYLRDVVKLKKVAK